MNLKGTSCLEKRVKIKCLRTHPRNTNLNIYPTKCGQRLKVKINLRLWDAILETEHLAQLALRDLPPPEMPDLDVVLLHFPFLSHECEWLHLWSKLHRNITRVCPPYAILLLSQCHQGTSREAWPTMATETSYHGSFPPFQGTRRFHG